MLVAAAFHCFAAIMFIEFKCRILIRTEGVPVGNPYSKLYCCWCAYILLLDASYTAFIVPIGVGFDTSYQQWNWTGYLDFIAGKLSAQM